MNDNTFQRYEYKYLLDGAQRSYIEKALKEYMMPDPHGESAVFNVYFDTPDFRLIRRSLDKPLYKEKLRLRSYGQAKPGDDVFLEIKKKYDGIVYKRRILINEKAAMDFISGGAPLPEDSQIGRELDYFRRFYRGLEPAVFISYNRAAYYADDELRMTFDKNICFRTNQLSLDSRAGGEQLLASWKSLLEVKAGAAIPLWFVKLMDETGIRRTAFSKYGRAYEAIQQRNAIESRGVICA